MPIAFRAARAVPRRRAAAALLLLTTLATPLAAQGGTDVYLVPLSAEGRTVRVGAPRNLTARAGYDNQPSFTPDGAWVLYTSTREDQQADIWKVPVRGGAPVRVTTTAPESEYSATPIPGRAGWASVVRVERDSTQRLWAVPVVGSGTSTVLLPALKPVGYHAWVDAGTVVTFVLGDPATLQVADVASGTATVVARRIGRALQQVPGRRAVSFVQLGDSAHVAVYDAGTRTVSRLAPLPPGSDYHVWTPGGVLLASAGSRLLAWGATGWTEVADLSGAGVTGISRLAVSPDGRWLALVAADGAAGAGR